MGRVVVSEQDFDAKQELWLLRAEHKNVGAAVSFVGYVRDSNLVNGAGHLERVDILEIHHYPKMTHKVLEQLRLKAIKDWNLIGCTIMHRYGKLKPQEQIVLVITLSEHRDTAFEACKFVMDFLKSNAPFWKKEINESNQQWVDSKLSDQLALDKWHDYL